MWSSVNMTPYMSLTVHTITPDWKLESRCLQTTYFPESHTADNLAAALRAALQEWQLDEKKLSAITTDNAANIYAAIRSLHWPWLNCFGHNLNLAVTNGLHDQRQKTERALGLCRNIVGASSHSWQRKHELHKKQVDLGLPKHSLITVSIKREFLRGSNVKKGAYIYALHHINKLYLNVGYIKIENHFLNCNFFSVFFIK